MEEHPKPTQADIHALLELIPLFEAPNRDHGEWGEFKDGIMPMFRLGEADSKFMKRAYEHKFVYSFAWRNSKDEAERLTDDPDALKTADFKKIQKQITTHVRMANSAKETSHYFNPPANIDVVQTTCYILI